MERLDPQQLQEAILTAPAWARIGITMPDQRMREQAAAELANSIADRLTRAYTPQDPDQLRLL